MDPKEVELRLIALGVHITRCYKCKRKIFFVNTKHRRFAPVTMELKSHFIDCPGADEIRKETIRTGVLESLEKAKSK